MLNKKQVKYMKCIGGIAFVLATFAAISLSLSIINVLGNYEKSNGIILLTSFAETLIFAMVYAFVRTPLLFAIETIGERASEMQFAKWIEPTDKKKTPEEILLDTVLDVETEFEEPVPCEKIWKAVSEKYGVDWMYLTGIYKKSGLKKERRICMYLMKKCGKFNYDEIAEEMSMKNGEIVFREIHALYTVMKKNEKLREEVLDIVEVLK